MKYWIRCIRNGGDSYTSYEGMDQSTIIRLLTELGCSSIQFISEADFLAALEN